MDERLADVVEELGKQDVPKWVVKVLQEAKPEWLINYIHFKKCIGLPWWLSCEILKEDELKILDWPTTWFYNLCYVPREDEWHKKIMEHDFEIAHYVRENDEIYFSSGTYDPTGKYQPKNYLEQQPNVKTDTLDELSFQDFLEEKSRSYLTEAFDVEQGLLGYLRDEFIKNKLATWYNGQAKEWLDKMYLEIPNEKTKSKAAWSTKTAIIKGMYSKTFFKKIKVVKTHIKSELTMMQVPWLAIDETSLVNLTAKRKGHTKLSYENEQGLRKYYSYPIMQIIAFVRDKRWYQTPEMITILDNDLVKGALLKILSCEEFTDFNTLLEESKRQIKKFLDKRKKEAREKARENRQKRIEKQQNEKLRIQLEQAKKARIKLQEQIEAQRKELEKTQTVFISDSESDSESDNDWTGPVIPYGGKNDQEAKYTELLLKSAEKKKEQKRLIETIYEEREDSDLLLYDLDTFDSQRCIETIEADSKTDDDWIQNTEKEYMTSREEREQWLANIIAAKDDKAEDESKDEAKDESKDEAKDESKKAPRTPTEWQQARAKYVKFLSIADSPKFRKFKDEMEKKKKEARIQKERQEARESRAAEKPDLDFNAINELYVEHQDDFLGYLMIKDIREEKRRQKRMELFELERMEWYKSPFAVTNSLYVQEEQEQRKKAEEQIKKAEEQRKGAKQSATALKLKGGQFYKPLPNSLYVQKAEEQRKKAEEQRNKRKARLLRAWARQKALTLAQIKRYRTKAIADARYDLKESLFKTEINTPVSRKQEPVSVEQEPGSGKKESGSPESRNVVDGRTPEVPTGSKKFDKISQVPEVPELKLKLRF